MTKYKAWLILYGKDDTKKSKNKFNEFNLFRLFYKIYLIRNQDNLT